MLYFRYNFNISVIKIYVTKEKNKVNILKYCLGVGEKHLLRVSLNYLQHLYWVF